MLKKILFIHLIFINITCFAQITFEKGYFIDNGDKKTDCLIKNMDWHNNPSEFQYKLSETDKENTKTIRYVKEFGIYNVSKYSRFTLPVERSSNSINQISESREPVFKEETLYLKTLVEGKASLYLLHFGNQKKYFIKTDALNIEQLIFKNYLTGISKNKIKSNYQFRKQLWNTLKCTDFTIEKVNKLKYNEKELVAFVIAYNTCKKVPFTQYNKKQKRESFYLSVRPGINVSSLNIENGISNARNTEFDNLTTFRIGVEAEYVLPFNKNKWSIFVEPTYQYYNAEQELASQSVSVSYKSVEIPFGIRHYFFLNKASKIFINAAVLADFSINSKIDFENSSNLEIGSEKINFAYGIGFKYLNKFSVELRNHTNKELLNDYSFWVSDYKKLSLVFGYTLF